MVIVLQHSFIMFMTLEKNYLMYVRLDFIEIKWQSPFNL